MEHSESGKMCCSRGRRPDPDKKEHIIRIAQEMFAHHGFSVSMNKIAEAAGVSKQTIYNLFGTKMELFGAVIRISADEMLEAIPVSRMDRPLKETLQSIAWNLLDMLMGDRLPLVYRMMFLAPETVGQDLVRTFYENGPKQGLMQMAAFLRSVDEDGILSVPDPVLAAEAFFGMLKGHLIVRSLLNLDRECDRDALQNRVDYCVEMFLKHHAA